MSIRARLNRLLLLGILPLVLVVGVALLAMFRSALRSRFDDGLSARLHALASFIKHEPEGIELDSKEAGLARYDDEESGEFYQVWRLGPGAPMGESILRSPSLGPQSLEARAPEPAREVFWTATLPDGRGIRCVAATLAADPERLDDGEPAPPNAVPDWAAGRSIDLLIVVAQDRGELDSSMMLLAIALGGAGVVIVAGVLLGVRVALIKGLAPLRQLSARVASIDPDKGEAVILADAPEELGPIVDRTNGLIERAKQAISRERDVVSSTAHEMRNPIAEILTATELALSRPRGAEDYRATLEVVATTATRMGRAVDSLLRLARVRAGREAPNLKAVNVAGAIVPAWSRLVEPLRVSGVRVEHDCPSSPAVRADEGMLLVIFENLMSNMAAHTPPGGYALVRARAEPGALLLRFSNGVDAPRAVDQHTDTQHASDPRDPPRPIEHANHAGLGLFIARGMAKVCGGDLRWAAGPREFVAELRLLSADPSAE